MAYPVPTLYNPKVNVNAPGTTVNYWADTDANQVSGAIVQMMGNINALSASVAAATSDFPTWTGSVFIPFSGSVVGKVGFDSWNPAAHAGETMAVTLASLSTSYYTSDIVDNAFVSSTVLTMSRGLFNSTNLAAAMPTGSFPTGTYNNLWVSYWTLSGNFANVYTSASKWDTVSSSFNTLSGNLNSSASIWNANATGALSTSFDTLSGNLDSSSSIWNSLSSSYYGWTGSIDTSVANSAQVSASYWGTAGEVAASGVGTYNAFWNLSATLNLSATVWNASAFTTSSNWNPVGTVFDITGSVKASQGGVFSGSVEASASFIMKSPNGTRWSITIDNAGILSSTALP
jgi:hypothetical protein